MGSIETERLLLRPFRLSDLESFFSIYGDPEVTHYTERGPFWTLDDAREALERGIAAHERLGFGFWAVELKTSGEVIGSCRFRPLNNRAAVELGFHLARRFWQQGYATEAVSAGVFYALSTLGVPRVVAMTRPENLSARRVLEKSGFSHEGEEQDAGGRWAVYAASR
jgi:ribosomal-protein-alanine N-acetyltransferase